jgi:uncharacterized membrane protein
MTNKAANAALGGGGSVPAIEPAEPSPLRRAWRKLRSTHPGLVLAALDLTGLAIASYLSYVELRGESPSCGILHGCENVAKSQWSHIGPVPVAVFGVFLSITLLILALAWWRTNRYSLLLWHYGLSLIGVGFEGWFQFAQVFLIKDVCVWCESYGISLIARFLIALWVYLRTPNPNKALA